MKKFSIFSALLFSAASFVAYAQQNHSSCLSVHPNGPLNFQTINDAVSSNGTFLNSEATSGCALGYPLTASNSSSNDTLVIVAGHKIEYDNNFYTVTDNVQGSETRRIAQPGTGHVVVVYGTLQHSASSSTRNLDVPEGTTLIIMPGGQLLSSRNSNRLRVQGTLIVEEGGSISIGGGGGAALNIEGNGHMVLNGTVTANDININGTLTGTGTLSVNGNGNITGDGNGTYNGVPIPSGNQGIPSPLNLAGSVPTWTGSSWHNGKLPANGLPVIIAENALNGASPMDQMEGVELSQITINAEKELVVGPGQSIASGFNLYMRDNAKIILDADATGYAMIVFDGFRHMSESAEIVFKQRLVGEGWHNIANPFKNQKANSFGSDVGADLHPNVRNLYKWDAGSNYTWSAVLNGNVDLEEGRGYFGYFGTNGVQSGAGPWTVEMSGDPITFVSNSLQYSEVDGHTWQSFRDMSQTNGWNMVANPFTAALDYSSINRTNINNGFYIWETNGNGHDRYVGYSGAGIAEPYIAPGQSFWVQTTAATTMNMQMRQNATTAARPDFLRGGFDRLVLRTVSLADSTLHDYTVVATIDGTTDGFDGEWDAHKFYNTGDIPNLYSTYNDQIIAVNAVNYGPGHNGKKVVPIAFRAPQQGMNYSIAFDDEFMVNHYAVYLEDKKTGTFTDMTSSAYSFVNDTAYVDRFNLHFLAGALSITELEEAAKANFRAWVYDNAAYIESHIDVRNAGVSLTDMGGRTIFSTHADLQKGARTELSLPNVSSGVYLLQVEGQKPVKVNIH